MLKRLSKIPPFFFWPASAIAAGDSYPDISSLKRPRSSSPADRATIVPSGARLT